MAVTATEIAAAVRAGRLTPRQATVDALDRIAARDPDLLAFRVVRASQAPIEADDVAARPDLARLPLAGVPIAVKDNVAVAGESLGNGCSGSSRAPSAADHPVVARLRAAGAVIVGLTNVPELCVFGTTDTEVGITRNPWSRERSPGGSSGGSASAVASGMVPLAHGNDGMGSIRIPAACTGLIGIKPGSGVVPAELGNGSWFGMAENGPLATTAADCALMLSVMAAKPEWSTLDEPSSLRIGVSVKPPLIGLPVDSQFVAAARSAGARLAEAGHQVRALEPRYPNSAGPAALARWFAGAELDARLLADRSRLGRRVATHARLGRLMLRLGSPRPGGRTAWLVKAELAFDKVDVLITPALAQPPLAAVAWHRRSWAANVVANIRYAPFAAPWNLAGWPAMAVPAGLHSDGLPLSVQLIARPGGEHLLLRVAAQLEQLQPWTRIAPVYPSG